MKFLCAAMAAALVVSGVGCSAVHSRGCGNGACQVSQAQLMQGRCAPNQGLLSGLCSSLGSCKKNCGDSCGDTCCGDECCGDCCGGEVGCCDSGCYQSGACGCNGYGCDACGGGCLQNGLHRVLDCTCARDNNYNFTPGPPGGQVAYPYYTVRGPRDFLHSCPPTIGPR